MVRGDMVVKIMEQGRPKDVVIREGEVGAGALVHTGTKPSGDVF